MQKNPTTIKLQAYLAHAGVASRRKAELLIEQNLVTVNGKVATIGQRIDPSSDNVAVKGIAIKQNEVLRYFLINKPKGYISTTNDEKGRKTVLDLLPSIAERIYPVGRLDQESEGLLVLTNDGELAQKLTHPKYEVTKTYEVLVAGHPTKKALEHLRRGVKLNDGFTKPAEVTVLNKDDTGTWLEIKISEGRNRQVRRMTERVGYETLELVRTQMGPFDIGELEDKLYIEIDPETIKRLKQGL